MTSSRPSEKPQLKVMLCSPRGFCAGVVRAIDTVERALAIYGKPVYVRHEIVHNRYVVESLRQKGAVFVEELDEIPDTRCAGDLLGPRRAKIRTGRGRQPQAAGHRCHLSARHQGSSGGRNSFSARGATSCSSGMKVIRKSPGPWGSFRPAPSAWCKPPRRRRRSSRKNPDDLAYVTQTTLSVDDTAEIVATLQKRFPNIAGPHKEDICYATTNRQEAVKRVAPVVDAMIVVGSPNSSNSQRLKEVALRNGCPHAELLQRAEDINWDKFGAIGRLGLTAGASAPEVLIEEIIDAFAARYEVSVETVSAVEESGIFFPLPRQVRSSGEAAE